MATRSLVFLLFLAAAAPAQSVLVITPDAFRPALKKWRAHREAQGFKVTVAPPKDAAEAATKGHDYILILGDAKHVPCTYRKGVIIADYERDPRIASDNHLADTDGDTLPDLAIGRLPADDVDEAEALLAKVLRYETTRDYSWWRRRINVIAGVGGFGKLQDGVLEAVTTKFLTAGIPELFDLHVTYCNPNSSFCPSPWKVTETTLERFNEGALIVAYMGHGSRQRLDTMRFKDERFRIFEEDDADALTSRHSAPIAMLIACSSGHFDGAPDCLGEVMLKRPLGPVALIASSRVSMPYANGVFSRELLEAIFRGGHKTLGAMFLQAKRRLVKPKPGDVDRLQIDGLARMFWQKDLKKLALEREEHLYLYNLLGDPTMHVPMPRKASIEAVVEGEHIRIRGTSPVSGSATVELVIPRTPYRAKRTGDKEADFLKTYANANRRHVARIKLTVGDGTFSVTVPKSTGTFVARVFIEGENDAAAAATRITIP